MIGAFSCSKHEADFYRDDDVSLARHVAEILAPYFYALRAAEEARRLAIEEAEGRAREEGLREGALRLTEELERERQRIGMDLHDQTLADLTRIVRRLETLREGTPTRETLSPAIEGLHRCVAELRRIIDDARPNVLELFGFAEGVEDFLGRALCDLGIEWRLEDASGGLVDTLDPALRVACFASCRRRSTTPRVMPSLPGSRSRSKPRATAPCASTCGTTGSASPRCRSAGASAASATCRRARG